MSTERPHHFTNFLLSFKTISLKSDLFHDLIHVYSSSRGQTAPRGQSFDVNRNTLSLRSSVASFKSETTIVSEKSIVLHFSHTKAYGTKLTLSQGHYLNKCGSTRSPNAECQVSRSSAFWFRRRRFFKVFTIYGWAWWPFWSCEQNPLNKVLFHYPIEAPYEI